MKNPNIFVASLALSVLTACGAAAPVTVTPQAPERSNYVSIPNVNGRSENILIKYRTDMCLDNNLGGPNAVDTELRKRIVWNGVESFIVLALNNLDGQVNAPRLYVARSRTGITRTLEASGNSVQEDYMLGELGYRCSIGKKTELK